MGKMTPEVKEFIERKGLLEQYTRVVTQVAATPQRHYGNYSPDEVHDAIMKCSREFKKCEAAAFVCVRTDDEDVKHTWVEYVDLDIAPDYIPDENHSRGCAIC